MLQTQTRIVLRSGLKTIKNCTTVFTNLIRFAGKAIRKLIKDNTIMRLPQAIHTRYRANLHNEAKAKGRHTGPGMLTILFKLVWPSCFLIASFLVLPST